MTRYSSTIGFDFVEGEEGGRRQLVVIRRTKVKYEDHRSAKPGLYNAANFEAQGRGAPPDEPPERRHELARPGPATPRWTAKRLTRYEPSLKSARQQVTRHAGDDAGNKIDR